MATARDIIDCAISQIGTVEKPNNNVKYNTEYYGREVSGSEYPWCACFTWWVFKHASASNLYFGGQKTALCQTLADWFKSKGQWHTTKPQPGDLVFYKFSSNSRYTDHVGIIEMINSDGTLTTIEGNTSDSSDNNGGMVKRRIRSLKSVVGFGRPKYTTKKEYLYKGVDVSAAQTSVDYAKLKAAGAEFAIVKIIRKDMNPDAMFEKHYAGFTTNGIPIFSVYNYSYATTVEKARNDANVVIKTLAGRRTAVCMDVEDKVMKNLGKALVDIINAYQEVIESHGLPFMLYTGMAFYNTYIKPYEASLKCKDIWMARYYKSDTVMPFYEDPDQSKKPHSNLVGWQYTSHGSVAGYNGNIDLDIVYRDIDSVKPVPADIITRVKTQGSNLNIRNRPVNGAIVGKLSNGTVIKVLDITPEGWYKIGDSRYVSNNYVESNTVGVITTGALNIRDSDSTKGKIIGRYYKGDTVTILAQSVTGWYLTPLGWVSNNYVKR